MTAAAPEIPDSLRQLMAEMGPRWGQDIPGNVRRTIEAFTPLLATAPKDGVQVTRNLRYGDDPRHELDVFAPTAGPAGAKPVVLFVHGGAFVDGERDRSPEIYSNVLYYFARHGVVGINMEYRLAPAHRYPAGAQDVAAAVAWTRRHIAEYGGDPERIFLVGHSAGAAHAGAYAYDMRLQPASGPGIAGLIVLSGRVRAETLPENPNAPKVKAYYGDDPAALEDGSAVTHVSKDSVPTMIAVAEYENPLIDVHCAELFHRLAAAKRRAPRLVWLAGHTHTSIIAHFNTAEDHLGREMLEFIRLGR
jgi:acetyl esterase/lipase